MKLAITLVLLVFSAGCAAAATILDIVIASEIHTTLEDAVLAAPAFIAEVLGDDTANLTLFAPDDIAFGNLVGAVGQDYVNDLLSPPWSSHLSCVLTSHVIGSTVKSTDITGPTGVPTRSGYIVSVDNEFGTVSVDGIPVTSADIEASNGFIHSISEILILPPCVTTSIYDFGSSVDDLSTLISLVDLAGLNETLTTTRPLTLYAPTNEAFAQLPSDVVEYLTSYPSALVEVLTYHAVNDILLVGGPDLSGKDFPTINGNNVTVGMMGLRTTVEGALITSADNLASNGVVHIIDSVLIPPGFALPSRSPPPSPSPSLASVSKPVEKEEKSMRISSSSDDEDMGKMGKGGNKMGKGGGKMGKGGGKMGSMGMSMGTSKSKRTRSLRPAGFRGV